MEKILKIQIGQPPILVWQNGGKSASMDFFYKV